MNASISPAGAPAKIPASVAPLPPMSRSLIARRKSSNVAMQTLCGLSTLLAIIPLLLVLSYVAVKGVQVMNPAFFTQVESPANEAGGGIGHSIVGTLMLVGLACVIGLPFGILGGIYLSEFGGNRLGFAIRFAADVLNGVPSIIVGIFVYGIAVVPVTKATNGEIRFSAWAGGLALGIMMIPTIMRTTEEIVRLVPMSLREGALALGDTRWHSVFKIVLASAKGGVVTGVLLAIARVAGETAPLLFTAGTSAFLNTKPNDPTASLPVTIYFFATSSFENRQAQAWGGALLLVTLIMLLSIAARYFTRSKDFG